MPSSNFRSLQRRIYQHLLDELDSGQSPVFVKSRHIAAELDVSVKRVGSAMATLEQKEAKSFRLYRRGGNSNGTTWRIEARESDVTISDDDLFIEK